MLDLVRQGLTHTGADKDKVFIVRGKQVTLADALHYFNRKGIKDPATLLDDNPMIPGNDHSSPEDYDVQTPLSSRGDNMELTAITSTPDYDTRPHSPDFTALIANPERVTYLKTVDIASERLRQICDQFGYGPLPALPPFRTLDVEAHIQDERPHPESIKYFEAIHGQAQKYYREVLLQRDISLTSSSNTWSATSDESLSDQFYYLMYHGYSNLWNNQRRTAFENFEKASGMIEQLLREGHVSFLIYIFDLVIRHDGTGFEEPLLMILEQLTRFSEIVWRNKENPIYNIAQWLILAPPDVSKSWVALSTMRKLLDFFQDSIGYFHQETIALLQTFATGLLNKKLYRESAIRFQQLVDAVSTTKGRYCYEAAYALRSTSEAYFHSGQFRESLQAIQMALDSSRGIPQLEEREIQVRCLRALAEISNVTHRRDDALKSIGYVVEICAAVFEPEHPFTKRARMHQKSLRKGEQMVEGALPPMVYRLGRGGNAAKYVWTSRSSPTRLQA